MFCRPKHTAATKHLFVGNCGTALGYSEEAIRAQFSQLGAVGVCIPAESSYIYVSFPSVELAEEALGTLTSTPCAALGNRQLTVKYADVRRPKVPYLSLDSFMCLTAHSRTLFVAAPGLKQCCACRCVRSSMCAPAQRSAAFRGCTCSTNSSPSRRSRCPLNHCCIYYRMQCCWELPLLGMQLTKNVSEH